MGAGPEVALEAGLSDMNMIQAAMGIQWRSMSRGEAHALLG